MNLIEIRRDFPSEAQCITYLEKMRWPEGVRCLKCDHNKVSKFTTEAGERTIKRGGKERKVPVPARHLYQCLNPKCKHQFSVRVGTIFNDSHLPLRVWFTAVALMLNAKKGLSAKQMERDLGVNYRTAWYLCHRIRKAMEQNRDNKLTGMIEVDETFVGGRYDRRRKRGPYEKQPVIGILQRTSEQASSKVIAFPIPDTGKLMLTGCVSAHVSPSAELVCTDENPSYRILSKRGFEHETVQHIALEYVRRDDRRIHTNSIENFWSLFKRGLIGSFHQVSVKHLRRYLNEFSYRFNERDAEDLFAMTMLNLLASIPLHYRQLIAPVRV